MRDQAVGNHGVADGSGWDADPWWSPTRGESLGAVTREVVDLAGAFSGLPTWYLGRFVGSAVLPVAVSGAAVGVAVGVPFSWHGTICRRMVSRLGPNVAGDLAEVPNYARAPAAVRLGIGCYAGVPLLASADRLLGVLAGWDVRPRPDLPPLLGRTLWTLARLLTPTFEAVLEQDAQRRAEEVAAVRARSAELLTRRPGRRGWGLLLDGEDHRAEEHGHPVGMVLVDVGPVRSTTQVQRASRCLDDVHPGLVTARLSAREVALLVVGDDVHHLPGIAANTADTLRENGFRPTVAWASRAEATGLRAVWALAERRLVEARRAEVGSGGSVGSGESIGFGESACHSESSGGS